MGLRNKFFSKEGSATPLRDFLYVNETRFDGRAGLEPVGDESFAGPEAIDIVVDQRVDRQLESYFPRLNPLHHEVKRRFAIEPAAVLQQMGARLVCQRRVEVLYRVREVHMEPLPENSMAIVTFGYPIYVSALR